jgi:hypothetical protein
MTPKECDREPARVGTLLRVELAQISQNRNSRNSKDKIMSLHIRALGIQYVALRLITGEISNIVGTTNSILVHGFRFDTSLA